MPTITCDAQLNDQCEGNLRQLGALIFVPLCSKKWRKIHLCVHCYAIVRPLATRKITIGDQLVHSFLVSPPGDDELVEPRVLDCRDGEGLVAEWLRNLTMGGRNGAPS